MLFTKTKAQDVQPLIQLMREVGQKHGGKTPAQVAINWCICKGTLPIPGRVGELQTKRRVYVAAVLICTLGLTCDWLKASAEAGVMFVYSGSGSRQT